MLELQEGFLIWRLLLRPGFCSGLLRQIFRQGNNKKNSRYSCCASAYRQNRRLISCFLSILPIANLLFFFPFPSKCAFFEWWNRPILQFLIFSVCRKMETKRTISIYVKGKVKKSALVIVNRTGCSLKSIHLGVN